VLRQNRAALKQDEANSSPEADSDIHDDSRTDSSTLEQDSPDDGALDSEERAATLGALGEHLDGLRAEWDVLTACVGELHNLLAPADFNEALIACGLDPLPGCEPVGTEEPATTTSTGLANTVAAPLDSSSGLDDADELSVNRRLVEVLAMIQQNLESTSARDASGISVPADLTTAIAHEVAEKIRESLHTGDGSPGQIAGKGESAPAAYWKNVEAQGTPRRIPLDDIQAVIDELTKSP
jgi:hypothetical protein